MTTTIHTATTALPLVKAYEATHTDPCESDLYQDLLYNLAGFDDEHTTDDLSVIAFTDGSTIEMSGGEQHAVAPLDHPAGTATETIEDTRDKYGRGHTVEVTVTSDGNWWEATIETTDHGGHMTTLNEHSEVIETGRPTVTMQTAEQILREVITCLDVDGIAA